jgi:hypothetical protein
MTLTSKLILLFCLPIYCASAGPITYVIGNNDAEGTHHFGTIDLTTGAFQQIGPNAPVGTEGLAWGPNGSLLTLAYNSDLYSINPATGTYTLVGPTGLDDCTTADSSCGPTSVYATDVQNSLYSVNPATASLNPDGKINFDEEALFGVGGSLYATFNALVFDFATQGPASVAVQPALYRIDPSTGVATTHIAPTDLAMVQWLV